MYELANDCHDWLSDDSFAAMLNKESPVVFKVGGTYYWFMSDKTGWRANDNTVATTPSMSGPWTIQGAVAPVGGTKISMPTYLGTWKLDVGEGTWTQ